MGALLPTEQERAFNIRFEEMMLGGAPKNTTIYTDFVASKAPNKEIAMEELEDINEIDDKGWTGFLKHDGLLYIPDYAIRGFIKSSLEIAIAIGSVDKVSWYKKWVDSMVFVFPRRILIGGKSEPDGVLERPLRAQTAQGPRVALAKSEYVNPGTEISFKIRLQENHKGLTWDVIDKCLDYGVRVGIGQWRGSGGYGRFTWKEIPVSV